MAKVFIGNIKGPQGEQGPQGPQGVQGIQGPQGEQGPAGMGVPGSAGQFIGFNEAGEPVAQDMPAELDYLDGVTSNVQTQIDNKGNIAYATCSTAAATAAKVVSISGNTNWELKSGSIIVVKFTNTNTASNPTLNVNGTGAKSIWYNTAKITTSYLSYAGYASRPIIYMYDGTQYVFLGWSVDVNTTYSVATTSANGLMSSTDKTKLDGIASGANAYTHPNSGVTAGTYRSVTVNAAGHVTAGSNPTITVAQGGTGATTFTSGAALVGAGTSAVTTRSITNNTANTSAITGSTNLVTMNTLKFALNRTTGPGTADTNYSTYMMRAIGASTTDLTAGTSNLTSGAIYLVYE